MISFYVTSNVQGLFIELNCVIKQAYVEQTATPVLEVSDPMALVGTKMYPVLKHYVWTIANEQFIQIFDANADKFYSKVMKFMKMLVMNNTQWGIDNHYIRDKVFIDVVNAYEAWFVKQGRQALNEAGINWEKAAAVVKPNMAEESYVYNKEELFDYPPSGGGVSSELSRLSRVLPGINERVKYPCKCHGAGENWEKHDSLHSVIMHLNDSAGWSREQIADWIETLDVDTTFKVEVDDENPKVNKVQDSIVIETSTPKSPGLMQFMDKFIKDELKKQMDDYYKHLTFFNTPVVNPETTFEFKITGEWNV